MEQLDRRPDAMWRTGTLWSFRNEAKVYGSPALDAGGSGLNTTLPSLLTTTLTTTLSGPQHHPHGCPPPSLLAAAWHELTGEGQNPLPGVVEELRAAEVPPQVQLPAAGAAAAAAVRKAGGRGPGAAGARGKKTEALAWLVSGEGPP